MRMRMGTKKTEQYTPVKGGSPTRLYLRKALYLVHSPLSAMLYEEKYPDGLQMKQFYTQRIEQISEYNCNHYVGFGKDLLLAKSDDDDTTEWFLVHNGTFQYLGESRCSRGELLTRYEQPCT
jgi:hypothetical protein